MYCIKMQATKTQKSNKIFCIVFQHCTHLTQDMRTSQAQYSAANKNAIPVQWTHLRYYIAPPSEPIFLVLKAPSHQCSCSKHRANIIARAQSTEPTLLLVLKAPSQHYFSCSKHRANIARAQSTEPTLLVLKAPSHHYCSCSKYRANIARAQSTEPNKTLCF